MKRLYIGKTCESRYNCATRIMLTDNYAIYKLSVSKWISKVTTLCNYSVMSPYVYLGAEVWYCCCKPQSLSMAISLFIQLGSRSAMRATRSRGLASSLSQDNCCLVRARNIKVSYHMKEWLKQSLLEMLGSSPLITARFDKLMNTGSLQHKNKFYRRFSERSLL